jgi:hypothetical protein
MVDYLFVYGRHETLKGTHFKIMEVVMKIGVIGAGTMGVGIIQVGTGIFADGPNAS